MPNIVKISSIKQTIGNKHSFPIIMKDKYSDNKKEYSSPAIKHYALPVANIMAAPGFNKLPVDEDKYIDLEEEIY